VPEAPADRLEAAGPIASPLSASTPSATPGRPGCGATAAPTCKGLVETKNWRDPRSASRYSHVVAREEWDRVEKLPAMGTERGKAVNE
jgi:hypothetical protein